MTASSSANRDESVVEGFGAEWTAFDQSDMSPAEREALFGQYFARFPWTALPSGAVGADIGCGSGRWAACVAPRVAALHCIDASAEAIEVARRTLATNANAHFHVAGVADLPVAPASLDFAYSLGVLHHVPDTAAAVRDCARVLKPGAPFLLYLYYAFDNQPAWYGALWRASDAVRRSVSRLPFRSRLVLTGVIALLVYLPLARLSRLLELLGRDVRSFPLSYYRRRSLYVMRNDALDRFGTSLEQRFTRNEITAMLMSAGFTGVSFNDDAPYWVALAYRS